MVRGGTSKGIFILENELPKDPALRDKYILEIFGSPDVRQIDGLGGADVMTSKLAIFGPSSREDADVDYTFGQVSFVEEKVDYKSNCGNISAGVGPFAIDHCLVKAVEPYTTVRIHQVNTDTIINAKVEVRDGKAAVNGDLHIDGVPTLGSTIELDFSDSAGGISGKLLPTGSVKDEIVTEDGKNYEVSVVDAGIPTVFIHAGTLGLSGTETPARIEGDSALMQKIEEIRGRCAVKMGFTDDWLMLKQAIGEELMRDLCAWYPALNDVAGNPAEQVLEGLAEVKRILNYNNTMLAERFRLSRTTLWRMQKRQED